MAAIPKNLHEKFVKFGNRQKVNFNQFRSLTTGNTQTQRGNEKNIFSKKNKRLDFA